MKTIMAEQETAERKQEIGEKRMNPDEPVSYVS
jgi:hypothetical protein